jgi:hypothetical protein
MQFAESGAQIALDTAIAKLVPVSPGTSVSEILIRNFP